MLKEGLRLALTAIGFRWKNWCLAAPTYRRSVVLRFLSFLVSPRRMLERDWQQRRRELNAAFARGRKIRRERIGT